MSYHDIFVEECARYTGGFSGMEVLVPGAGSGPEPALIRAAGARVTTLDIEGPVSVHGSIESVPFPDRKFDLVFCVATMEHVQNIDAGFSEMTRVSRGWVYSLAAPLWNSRRGHHFECLNHIPWAHLRLTRSVLGSLPLEHGGYPLREYVTYLFDSAAFNRIPSKRYVEACRDLPGLIRNDLWMDGQDELTPEIQTELCNYSPDELLATAHTFVSKKA